MQMSRLQIINKSHVFPYIVHMLYVSSDLHILVLMQCSTVDNYYRCIPCDFIGHRSISYLKIFYK